MTQPKTPPSELVHYGVKGMHWGVRKNVPNHPDYTVGQRQYDKKNYGRGGVKRINRHLNKGVDLATARRKEGVRRAKVRTAVSLGILFAPEIVKGAEVAGHTLKLSSGLLVQHIAVKAETNRGRAAAANIVGLPRTATTGPAYAKKSRGGVHKITSL